MHGFTDDTNRNILGYLGAGLIAVGCWMTFQFGYTMSLPHALALAGLTIAAGVMWGPIKKLAAEGTITERTARALRLVGVFFVVAELGSHLGYTVGHRVADVEMTGVQNATYTEARSAIDEDKSALEVARKERDELKSAHPWAVSVNAGSLRAQIPALDEALRQEERRGGCGPKCLALKERKAEIEGKIAKAEELNSVAVRIANLEQRLEGRRDTGKKTAYVSSKLVHQTAFVSQLATLELKPSEEARNWSQIGLGLFIAIVTTFLGPVCWYLATAERATASRREEFIKGRPEAPREPAPTPLRPAPERYDSNLLRRLNACLNGNPALAT